MGTDSEKLILPLLKAAEAVVYWDFSDCDTDSQLDINKLRAVCADYRGLLRVHDAAMAEEKGDGNDG